MKRILHVIPRAAALFSATIATLQCGAAEFDTNVDHLKVGGGQLIQELSGQAISSATGGTLFGYYTYIKGVDTLFAGAPENETTALFTFFRDTTNVLVTANGPLLILSRQGTTTLYLNGVPGGDFSSPDSFRAGTPIQTSLLRFQAVIDTLSQTANVVIQDTITSASVFTLDGHMYQLGRVGDVVRTMQTVHLNAPGQSPSAWFGGYSVAAEKSGPVQ